jgi:predicted CoA-binding protein
MEWKKNILHDDALIKDLLEHSSTIAVLGIKPESHANQPAFYVPRYLAEAGFDVIPVPVYYPEVTEILGKPVFRKLTEIGKEIDIVNIFRRSKDVMMHVREIIAAKPKAVWMQLGIYNDDAAEQLAQAGIRVVQDLCIMVEHRTLVGAGG